MNWLSNFIRPSIRSLVKEQKDVPDNLWQKCPSCEGMLFSRELVGNMNVCYHCDYHMPIDVKERLKLMFDDGQYDKISLPGVPFDPLKFKDKKKYSDRLKDSQAKTGEKDALVIAKGKIGGQNAVVAAFNFAFMGGSMGTAVGEGIVRAAEEAVKTKSALIVVPASGGARMQEGMLSLMQMPRTIIAVDMVKEQGLPYIVLLANPTTGGVSASFAMVGDIHISEPGATIGFAGRRVIEETVRETLPPDFQTAEYLLEHGMVDMVVARKDLNARIGTLLDLLMATTKPYAPKGKDSVNKDEDNKGGSNGKKSNPTKAAGTVAIKPADRVKKIPANNQHSAKGQKQAKRGK
ncbi:MAG TPA: acetyl-CoA carboxylase, carboxyltransferase subunit beta [Alphaproteobacteria bacterium]|nr:acetyl-CoA carboxylase, carboxyltransferase subunit beta [Alphaproteobacteria bacterium]